MKKFLSLLIVTLLIGLNSIAAVYADDETDEEAAEPTGPVSEISESHECEGENSFPDKQEADGTYYCVTLEPDEDQDEDGVANGVDNCALDRNGTGEDGEYNGSTTDQPDDEIDEDVHQSDRDNDGFGDECDDAPRADFVEDIMASEGLDVDSVSTQAEAAFGETLDTMGACLNTGGINHKHCNISTLRGISGEDQEKFNRLYEALLNKELVTTLEEPISNQGIYRKARVCSTKFLRDINGIVQPTISIDLYNPDLSDAELRAHFQELEFLITNDKCEEFFVQRCNPANNVNYIVGNQQELPTRVFCNNVQILFATSGSDLVKKYVSLIYRLAAGIIGVLAVVVIIINGIIISASGGESGTIDNAKNRIIQSLISLAILFLSGIILYSINPNFFRTENVQQVIETEAADVDPQSELEGAADDSGGVIDSGPILPPDEAAA